MRITRAIVKALSIVMLIIAIPGLLLSGAQADTLSVGTLKGPTGMGMAQLMTDYASEYNFTLAGAPDELTGAFISGQMPVIAVSSNLASVLYNKLGGDVRLLGLNTLGVLYVVSRDGQAPGIADLEGRKVLISGQGALPEYVMRFVLDQAGVNAELEFKSEHSEVSALAAAGEADIVVLPEPHVTALLAKDSSMQVSISLTDAFAEAAEKAGYESAVLSMGCVIARASYCEANEAEISRLSERIAQSIAFTETQPEQAAQYIAALGIMASAPVALKALPNCNIVWITGSEMRAQISPLFDILFAANPASVGGQVPGDDFYALYPVQ